DKAAAGADQHGCDPVAARELEDVRNELRADEVLRDQADAAEEEGAAEHSRGDRLDAVPIAVAKPGRQPDAEQRQRRAADEHPPAQTRLHVPELPMPYRAD